MFCKIIISEDNDAVNVESTIIGEDKKQVEDATDKKFEILIKANEPDLEQEIVDEIVSDGFYYDEDKGYGLYLFNPENLTVV